MGLLLGKLQCWDGLSFRNFQWPFGNYSYLIIIIINKTAPCCFPPRAKYVFVLFYFIVLLFHPSFNYHFIHIYEVCVIIIIIIIIITTTTTTTIVAILYLAQH